ncbi:MAG: class I SAM-dependent methyltransferase [Dehalococcoidia bacterium]|nr:class I SAM-dependent methyltransferase [Dehalococcoidia bacterium]
MDSPVRDAVQRQFSAAASGYANSAVHAAGPDLPVLLEAADPAPHEVALDIATGAGHTAMTLAPRCARVVANDITEGMLEVARENAQQRKITNISFEAGDAEALDYPPESFDLVTCRVSAHHFPHPGRFAAEAARVLRPGGRMVLIDTISPEDPALDTFENTIEYLRDNSHVRNWRAAEWLQMLGTAGFKTEVVARSGYELDGHAWVTRMKTPADNVAMIRKLFAEASPAWRGYLEVRDEPWGWTVPYGIFKAVKY